MSVLAYMKYKILDICIDSAFDGLINSLQLNPMQFNIGDAYNITVIRDDVDIEYIGFTVMSINSTTITGTCVQIFDSNGKYYGDSLIGTVNIDISNITDSMPNKSSGLNTIHELILSMHNKLNTFTDTIGTNRSSPHFELIINPEIVKTMKDQSTY